MKGVPIALIVAGIAIVLIGIAYWALLYRINTPSIGILLLEGFLFLGFCGCFFFLARLADISFRKDTPG